MARVIAACRRVVDLTKQNKWHRDADEELMAAIAELEAGAPARTETPEVKS